jgi:mRNA interferase MazF
LVTQSTPLSGSRGYATHVELDGALPVTSYVQRELIRAISRDRLLRKVGQVDHIDLLRIATILSRMLGI